MEIDTNSEKLKSLYISSLDEEEDEDEAPNDDVEVDVSDENDEDEECVPMTLGFPEKPKNQWSLMRQYFPSKAGGTPAWLDPINLPNEKSSLCDFCGEPLQFLLQVYAPLFKESTFHRTLFVFMCPSMACLLRDQHEQWKRYPEIPSRSVKVFRCQLPQENSFYSSKPPIDDGNQHPLIEGAILCNWCGTWNGDKICSSCKKHVIVLTAHWKSSKSSHKVHCRQLETSGQSSELAASNTLWPEYEITNEDECEDDESEMINDGDDSKLISTSHVDGSFNQVQTYFKGNRDTRSLASFQAKISLAPEQILRYSSSPQAKPLWPMSSGRPSKLNISKCNYCGGYRSFEFQVLPQLLYYFHVKDDEKSLDWATIVVYTCESSCGEQMGYKEEFAWVQLAS